MKDLLEYIAKSLVDSPDSVTVEETESGDGTVVLTLHVASSDMGRVIGKQGKIAKAIRTVVKSGASYQNKRVAVEISE